MYLGEIRFKPLETPHSEQYKSTHTYAKMKPAVGKPILQDKGEELDELSLGMYFHASFCHPADNIEKLYKMKKSGEACPYFWDNGEFKGNFVIEDITVASEKRLPGGALLSADVTINLVEFSELQFLKSLTAENATSEEVNPDDLVDIEAELEEEIASWEDASLSDMARRP